MNPPDENPCACGAGPAKGRLVVLKAVPPASLGVLIAFFPKCPVCWAVYMSMFSSVGLANVPYTRWLFPLLLAILTLHLVMLLRNAPKAGWMPFLLSFAGSVTVVWSRALAGTGAWVLLTGMTLIVVGSVINGRTNRLISKW